MPKVSGTDWECIPFQGQFTLNHVSDLRVLCHYSVVGSVGLTALFCSSPWGANAGLRVGEGAGGQLLLLEGCGLALPSSFHYLCA